MQPSRFVSLLILVVLPLARTMAQSDPGSQDQKSAPLAPSFKTEIQPLLQSKCVRCHGEKSLKADLDLSTFKGIVKGGESGPVIVTGKPDESPLYEKVHKGEMPPAKKDRLSEVQADSLRRWIASGAKSDSDPGDDVNPIAKAPLSQHDVIPIVLRHCTGCHGLRQKEGNLDLRSRASMLRGGKSGAAIVPGKPEASLLIKRIHLGQMPPPARLVEGSVKPVDQAETEILGRWISQGAPEIAIDPDIATNRPDPLVTDKDREFWAFQPPKPVTVPGVRHQERVRNPVDAFVLQKLEAKGLSLAPEAERLVLLRRASFDLTGLPPDPEEVRSFLADTDPNAYAVLIDRLLASPRYGERWCRYWLDLAGYSDSEGKREQDLPRPHAWRYRDYVIRAFNSDKGYDRFLMEQLAGDELADYENAPEITQEIYDNLVATGFLRMAPDATWANITGYAPDRIEVIADEIDILGSAVMGLTLKCARCHTHKFDPIPHRDYYRLVDVFKGAYDEYDWLKPDVRPGLGPVSEDPRGGRLLPFVTTAERRAWEASHAKIQKETDAIRLEIGKQTEVLCAKYREERLAGLPEVLRADLRTMLATTPGKRDAVQKYLATKFEAQLSVDANTLKMLDPAYKKAFEDADAKIRDLESRRSPEPKIQALWDRGEPSPTYIYRRGDFLSPSRLVGPGVPSVLTDGKDTAFEVKPPWPGAKKTGRRLAFARWITRPDHPLTARVAINRIWKHHMGSGIVKTLDNLGKAGSSPSHPDLLDWLAGEFVRSGWSIKAMHRLIMNSATYRQSSAVTPELVSMDPDNALYSRMPLVRLDAEALYDTQLVVAGRLNETRFGPADPVQVQPDGLVTPTGTQAGWRRMIYVRQARKQIPTHMENFDFPQMNPNCVERRDSIVALQALQLMNARMNHELAEEFSRRVRREAGTEAPKQIEQIYLIALNRLPSDEENRIGVEALAKLARHWQLASPGVGHTDPDAASRKAIATYCHAIMNSAGFLYVD
ncbi:MAG: putative rane protein [Planctomycetota bacterium]|nr:putative rane protein [Planctomycetota bacterium]